MANGKPRVKHRLAQRQAQHDAFPVRDDGKDGIPGKGNFAKPAKQPGSVNPRKR